jgi:hypothetical protein
LGRPGTLFDVDSGSPADTVEGEFVKKITNFPQPLDFLVSFDFWWFLPGVWERDIEWAMAFDD